MEKPETVREDQARKILAEALDKVEQLGLEFFTRQSSEGGMRNVTAKHVREENDVWFEELKK